MAYVKVSVEQARDRRIFFAKPIDLTLKPGEETKLEWHRDIKLKDDPVSNIPLPEPGKYRGTYMSRDSAHKVVSAYITGPGMVIEKENDEWMESDCSVSEFTFFLSFICRDDDPFLSICLKNDDDEDHAEDTQIKLSETCLVLELIR